MRLILLIIPGLEPRLSRRCTGCSIVASCMYGVYRGRLVVYPGVYRRLHIQGGVYLPYPPGRHIQPYTPYHTHQGGIYSLVHPMYTPGIPTTLCTPLGYPMYTLGMVHPMYTLWYTHHGARTTPWYTHRGVHSSPGYTLRFRTVTRRVLSVFLLRFGSQRGAFYQCFTLG